MSLIAKFGSNPRSATEAGVYLVPPALEKSAESLASAVHPNWSAVMRASREGRDFARQAHVRNVFQVFGRDLRSPAEFLICWAPVVEDSISGGTRTAYELAKKAGIPTYNLADRNQQIVFKSKIEELERNHVAQASGVPVLSDRLNQTIAATERPVVTISFINAAAPASSHSGAPVIYVGRSPWPAEKLQATWEKALGNNFIVGRDGTQADCAAKYEAQLPKRLAERHEPTRAAMNRIATAAMKNGAVTLVCHCHPGACHSHGIGRVLSSALQKMGYEVRLPQLEQQRKSDRQRDVLPVGRSR